MQTLWATGRWYFGKFIANQQSFNPKNVRYACKNGIKPLHSSKEYILLTLESIFLLDPARTSLSDLRHMTYCTTSSSHTGLLTVLLVALQSSCQETVLHTTWHKTTDNIMIKYICIVRIRMKILPLCFDEIVDRKQYPSIWTWRYVAYNHAIW